MLDCIFCKLANGDIPTKTVFENENFRVILDLSPASKGHALILPKYHAANIFELPDTLVSEAFVLAKRMMRTLSKVLKCDGYNIVQNNGSAAGQTVFHFHIHLIPRYECDNVGITWIPGSLDEAYANQMLVEVEELLCEGDKW